MVIQNADGSKIIIDDVTGEKIEEPAKVVKVEKVEQNIKEETSLSIINKEVNAWEVAKRLIHMPEWELMIRFGYKDLSFIVDYIPLDNIEESLSLDLHELVKQGDIIEIEADDETISNYVVLEIMGNDKFGIDYICMKCTNKNKSDIDYSTKDIKVCGKPIKIKSGHILKVVGHAKRIIMGW